MSRYPVSGHRRFSTPGGGSRPRPAHGSSGSSSSGGAAAPRYAYIDPRAREDIGSERRTRLRFFGFARFIAIERETFLAFALGSF